LQILCIFYRLLVCKYCGNFILLAWPVVAKVFIKFDLYDQTTSLHPNSYIIFCCGTAQEKNCLKRAILGYCIILHLLNVNWENALALAVPFQSWFKIKIQLRPADIDSELIDAWYLTTCTISAVTLQYSVTFYKANLAGYCILNDQF